MIILLCSFTIRLSYGYKYTYIFVWKIYRYRI